MNEIKNGFSVYSVPFLLFRGSAVSTLSKTSSFDMLVVTTEQDEQDEQDEQEEQEEEDERRTLSGVRA